MAEPITIKALQDASLDAKSLEEVVNGNETKQVTTRLGESYPSVKKAMKTLFENGGLPATPFATKALMTASPLVDGKYAMVTNDAVNNGLYVKTAGAWVKSAYDPTALANTYTDGKIVAALNKKISTFDTIADLTASNLADGTYALVVNDTEGVNGYYQKQAGVWIKSKYRPPSSVAKELNEADSIKAQSGLSIHNYLKGAVYRPDGVITTVGLNKYTGAEDTALINGYINTDFNLVWSQTSKVAEILIPVNAKYIKKFNLKTVTNYSILSQENKVIGGGLTSGLKTLPDGAYKIQLTAVFAAPEENQNFAVDNIVFEGQSLFYDGNEVLRKIDAALITTTTPTATSEFLFSELPNFDTAVSIPESQNQSGLGLIKGFIFNNGSAFPRTGDIIAKIPIPATAKYLEVSMSTIVYIDITNEILGLIKVALSNGGKLAIPSGAKYLLVGVKQIYKEAQLARDKVTFYYDHNDKYVLNNTLVKDIISNAETNGFGKIMLAKNQYTIDGLDFRLYRKSLFAGYLPTVNFNIDVTGVVLDKGHYTSVQTAGKLTVSVHNLKRKIIAEKTVDVYKKPMPTAIKKAFSAQDKLQVLFIGDSLIHNNQNAIGREWLRMMNTDIGTETIVNNVVYPPTFNLGEGDIELVGTRGSAENRFEKANTLVTIMERDNATQENPFFNTDSPAVNAIGADGWHNKVDIVWYLQKICGAGKYPAYIYLACGVNDIVDLGWDIAKLAEVRDRMKSVLNRIKQACDTIAGGESGVKILLINHQFYPINEGAYRDYSPHRQRMVWAEHYEAYEDMVQNDTVNGVKLSTYVRFVDCASSFDIDYGYTYIPTRPNPRNAQLINTIYDTVHMGESGSAMYADALIRDFLYHECL